MSVSSLSAATTTKLRIAVIASSADRHSQLSGIVIRLGHLIAELESADVVLCADTAPQGDRPVLLLGETAAECAGRLPDTASDAQIDAALQAIALGLIVRSARTGRRVFDAAVDGLPVVLLTPREAQVLEAISGGMSNKVIARELSISLHTVKFHIESLFRKLGVRTRAEAVARGLERRQRDVVEV